LPFVGPPVKYPPELVPLPVPEMPGEFAVTGTNEGESFRKSVHR
jgi:hypothetical protein